MFVCVFVCSCMYICVFVSPEFVGSRICLCLCVCLFVGLRLSVLGLMVLWIRVSVWVCLCWLKPKRNLVQLYCSMLFNRGNGGTIVPVTEINQHTSRSCPEIEICSIFLKAVPIWGTFCYFCEPVSGNTNCSPKTQTSMTTAPRWASVPTRRQAFWMSKAAVFPTSRKCALSRKR